MKDTDLDARIRKFKRQSTGVSSQAHMDRIMESFGEHQELVLTKIDHSSLIVRKVEPMEIKPKDPENPTIHEATAVRLNNQDEKIIALNDSLKEANAKIKSLEKELENLRSIKRGI